MSLFPIDSTNAYSCLKECTKMVTIAQEALAERNEDAFMSAVTYAIHDLYQSFFYAHTGKPLTISREVLTPNADMNLNISLESGGRIYGCG